VTELLLVRHGETDWNVQGRWQGQTDVPLNRHGLEQAAAVAASQDGRPLAAIYTSDLRRAQQTAEALAGATGAPIYSDRRLREINLGIWEGMLFSDIEARDGARLRALREQPATHGAPGGETPADVQRRAIDVLREVAVAYPDARVAIVSHGLTLAAIKVYLLGLPLDDVWSYEPANASPEEFQLGPV
jgi:broad specificity phosphatase PhoE